MSTARTTELTLSARANAYVALTKPDVSFLVLMTTAAGYYMGVRGPVGWLHMVHAIFGTMLIAGGTAALNHYPERESDRTMRRTASRPLPSGVLQPREALAFGVALSVAVRDPLSLAISALPRHRLDVPRRLCARGNHDAPGGGPRGHPLVPANHPVCGRAGGRQPAPGHPGTGWCAVFLWRAGQLHSPGASV